MVHRPRATRCKNQGVDFSALFVGLECDLDQIWTAERNLSGTDELNSPAFLEVCRGALQIVLGCLVISGRRPNSAGAHKPEAWEIIGQP